MIQSAIRFSASGQQLIKTSGPGAYSSNTIQYIEAHFDLDESWAELDSVRALWHTDWKSSFCRYRQGTGREVFRASRGGRK